MPIYEIRPDGLNRASDSTFQILGLRERGDIQRLLRADIEVLETGLMVLAEEFSGWLESKRRIDLLCLDKKANLVVVELKRDEDGGHMELQALRYAAMVSTMTFDQAVDAHTRFCNPPNAVAAKSAILKFLDWSDVNEDNFGQETRIILAAANFGKEVTTTVLWLRERGIDIQCTRLKPYGLDGRALVDIQPLIPLPEATDYIERVHTKQSAEKAGKAGQLDVRIPFLSTLLERVNGRGVSKIVWRLTNSGALAGPIGRAGFQFGFVTGQLDSRIELLIMGDDAKQQLDMLKAFKAEIETTFGGALEWQEKETSRQRRIYYNFVGGGYQAAEANWPDIHERMIAAMLRLDHAVRPHVLKLPRGT